MKNALLAAILAVASLAAGCATYDATAAVQSDVPGTQPGQGPFPSQVVGP